MKPRKHHTVTQTTSLVLEPQIRRFAGSRYFGAVMGVLVLVLLALLAIRELAGIERLLAAEGASSVRAVVYELPIGAEIRVPVEPRTDVIRLVVYAYRRDGALPLTPLPIAARVVTKGEKGTESEVITADAPGTRTRVTADDASLAIGDPLTLDLDVHDVGAGEISVELEKVDGGDGMLVRAYRREQLSSAEVAIRNAVLGRSRKESLARAVWELGWDELTEAERLAVLGTRWLRVGKLSTGSRDLRSIPVALSPEPDHEHPVREDISLGRIALRGDERVAFLLHAGAGVKAVGDPSVAMTATIRVADGKTSTITSTGSLAVEPSADERSVEIETSRDQLVDVRASSSDAVVWLAHVPTWRATPKHPVVVESPETARVLRVAVRRPVDRQEKGDASIAAEVRVTAKSLRRPLVQTFRASRARSRYDRYDRADTPDPLEAPTERAAFFVAIPKGGIASIEPIDGKLDVTLAELDEKLPPPALLSRLENGALPPMQLVGEDEDDVFVPRRPSNAAAFDESARVVVRVARHLVPRQPTTQVALAHARHTAGPTKALGGRPFEGITRPFELEADKRRPLYLPIVATARTNATLIVGVERRPTAPPPAGLYERWTLPRSLVVGPQEVHAAFVLGDDVGPGKVSLAIRSPDGADGADAKVHLPWIAPNRGPRWIGGQFEE